MKYLVDSDWVVDWLKGREPAVERLSALAPDGLAISLITYGEIYEGIYSPRAQNPKQSEKAFRQFLRTVQVLPLNRSTMQRFARVRAQLRQSGNLLPDADLLIASTAIYHNLILLSGNRIHFQRIRELKVWAGPR